MYNDTYLLEKAYMAQKAANLIIREVERDEPNSASYVINGVLSLEDALGSLEVGARRLMKAEGKTESDYGLRGLGQVIKGD